MHRRSALVAAPSNGGGGAPRAANAARFSGCSTSQVLHVTSRAHQQWAETFPAHLLDSQYLSCIRCICDSAW